MTVTITAEDAADAAEALAEDLAEWESYDHDPDEQESQQNRQALIDRLNYAAFSRRAEPQLTHLEPLRALAALVLTGEPCPDDCDDSCPEWGHEMGEDGEIDALLYARGQARDALIALGGADEWGGKALEQEASNG